MKKPFHQRAGEFLEGKGFYIVLFLCIAAIAVSGYYLFASLNAFQTDVPAAATARITVTPTPAPKATVPATPRVTAAPAATPAVTAAPSAAPAATQAQTATSGQSAPASYIWPVQGEVLTGHSLEVLAYDPTMADWRTHAGIDVAAAQGDQVRAAAAGQVTAVTQDPMLGTTVTVAHGGGVTTVYANLASVPTVEAGDTVKAGDVLGSVGSSAIAESALASHLHFSMTQDGVPLDPLDYLP